MARSYPGQPANPPYPPPPAPEANPAGPPPAPSSRQQHAGYDAPLPSFENTPIDMVAETVEAIPDEEPNPFQRPGRFDRFKKLLKKPSREVSIRAGIAAAALLVGWGAGAQPWKSPPPRAAVTAKASSAKAAAAKAAAAKAAAAKANKARPTAVPAAQKAEAPRRVAVVAHDTPPVLAKARTETKVALASQGKVTTKSAAATKAAKAKAKAATKLSAKKAAAKKAVTAKASLKAKAKAKPKAVAKKATAKQG